MPKAYLSIKKDEIKISYSAKSGFNGITHNITHESLLNSKNLFEQMPLLVSEVSQAFSQLPGFKPKNIELYFIVDPSDVLYRFVSEIKGDANYLQNQANAIFSEEGLDTSQYYYTYQKIAPFVFQFVAVQKSYLEAILSLANNLECSLAGIMSWVAFVPKFAQTNDMFALLMSDHEFVLSELNGIFFYKKSEDKLDYELVANYASEFSVFKKTNPVLKVYSVTDDLTLEGFGGKIEKMLALSSEYNSASAYSSHMLVSDLLNSNYDYMQTPLNLLNLLPVPVVAKKSSVIAYAGVMSAILLLALGGFGLYYQNNNQVSPNDTNVLGNQVTPTEPSVEVAPPATEVVTEPAVLNKQDFTIRVENGAGVAGVAAKTKDLLSGLDYSVIEVGNADSSDYESSEIRVKSSKKEYGTLLAADLKDKYDVKVLEDLDEESAFDVLLIIGKN